MMHEKTEFHSTCYNLQVLCIIAENGGDQILTLADQAQ